jgi:hypothetical protein
LNIIIQTIRSIIDSKTKFVQTSPTKYTEILQNILIQLLNGNSWERNSVWNIIPSSPLFFLPLELRDELVIEVMSDPLGQKMLNPYLSKQPTIVPLTLSLLINNLQLLSKAIAPNKISQLDQYGFQQNVKVSFPPLLTQDEKTNEEVVMTVHAVERYLFPSLRSKNHQACLRAYQTYRTFCEKLLVQSIENNDLVLMKLGSAVHFRFCRFCLGQSIPSLQNILIQEFYSFVIDPLSVFVGLKVHENYGQYLFDNLIDKYFSYTVNESPFGNLLYSIISFSYCEKLCGIEHVYSQLSELLLQRIYQDIPLKFQATWRQFPSSSSIYLKDSKFTETYKQIRNSLSKISLPSDYRNFVLNNFFNGRKENQQLFVGCIDISVLSEENMKSLQNYRCLPSG